jgi:TonB-linked SusC/RagA family outer membrane protein
MKRLFLGLFVVCCCLAGVSGEAFGQRTVSGKITSGEDNSPLRGARIVAKGTRSGTFTDARGVYSLAVPDGATTLVISSVGFIQQEIPINDRATIDVALKVDSKLLDEVVVTSFGIEREKKSLGYAVQEVSAREIQSANQPNIVSALQGRVAGVTITGGGGSPGAGANIIIRGITSLAPGADNQPLFVVDGIPISNATQSGNPLPSAGTNSGPGNQGEQFGFTNRAGDINPDDIESINVLKGPAATALYGLRAANGVIVITTKRGKSGQIAINFSSSGGFDNIAKTPRYQTIYGQGSLGITREPYSGNAFRTEGPPRSLTGEAIYDPNAIFETGNRLTTNLSASGGNNVATFYTSLSRFDQKGIVPFTDFARSTATLKGKVNLSEVFSVNASINYTNSGGSKPRGGDKSIFSSLSYWSPSYDIRDYQFPDGSPKNYTAGIIDQPLWFAKNSRYNDNVNRLIGDVGFAYEPLSWLSVRYQITLDTYSDSRTGYVPAILDVGTQVNGFVTEERLNSREINSNFLITARTNFTDELRGQLILGNAITDIYTDYLSSRGEGFAIPGFYDVSNTANFFAGRDQTRRRIVGFFANAELSWRDLLFVTLTGRNDISSTLPSASRSFFYPSASVSFVLSELIKDQLSPEFVNLIKFRASWAQVGKDVTPYSVGEYYQSAPGFPFNGVSGFRVDPFAGSLNLRPERTTGIDIGGDFRFFSDRLSLELTYATQTSDDQLFQIPVSNTTGYARFTQNGGRIVSNTIEGLLRLTAVETPEFNWTASLNFSRTRSEVLQMPVGIDEISFGGDPAGVTANKVVKGGAVGDIWGFDFFKNSTGKFIINQTTGFPVVKDSLVKVGNAFPDAQLGFINTFTWNGLSLSFFLEWRIGGSAVDMAERNFYRNGVAGFTDIRYKQVLFDGVTPPTADAPDGAPNTVPAYLNLVTFARGGVNSSKYFNIQDASWIRLRNVSLSYTFPRSFLEGSIFKTVGITLAGNNLWLNTPFRGYDPDALAYGSGTNVFGLVGRNTPALRSFTFGFNLGF